MIDGKLWEAVWPGRELPLELGSGGSIYLDKERRRNQHGVRKPSKGTGARVPGKEW